MAAKIDRRRKPTPRWEPGSSEAERKAIVGRIAKALAISKVMRRG